MSTEQNAGYGTEQNVGQNLGQGPTPPPPPPPPYTQQVPPRRLMRAPDDQMVAGVCGGLARYLGVDPTLVRVGAVVALVFGLPATLVAYLVAWAIMPVAAPPVPPVPPVR